MFLFLSDPLKLDERPTMTFVQELAALGFFGFAVYTTLVLI
jgi:hypothetical protein